ncbi:MAG: S-layer protein [Euryarchaeota archaeon]|nr:S-layer protein [Euryarchaeota archaeon]
MSVFRKITAAATSALMLGITFAGAVAAPVAYEGDYTKFGFINKTTGAPSSVVVVGEKAPGGASDTIAGADIAAQIGNLAFLTSTVTADPSAVELTGYYETPEIVMFGTNNTGVTNLNTAWFSNKTQYPEAADGAYWEIKIGGRYIVSTQNISAATVINTSRKLTFPLGGLYKVFYKYSSTNPNSPGGTTFYTSTKPGRWENITIPASAFRWEMCNSASSHTTAPHVDVIAGQIYYSLRTVNYTSGSSTSLADKDSPIPQYSPFKIGGKDYIFVNTSDGTYSGNLKIGSTAKAKVILSLGESTTVGVYSIKLVDIMSSGGVDKAYVEIIKDGVVIKSGYAKAGEVVKYGDEVVVVVHSVFLGTTIKSAEVTIATSMVEWIQGNEVIAGWKFSTWTYPKGAGGVGLLNADGYKMIKSITLYGPPTDVNSLTTGSTFALPGNIKIIFPSTDAKSYRIKVRTETTGKGEIKDLAKATGIAVSTSARYDIAKTIAVLDTEITATTKATYNIVLVGGSEANALVKDLVDRGISKVSWTATDGAVEYLANPYGTGKDVLIVAGATRAGTRKAVEDLIAKL